MYSKLSVTNEVQSIQGYVHAKRGRRKTHRRSAGLIVDPQGNHGGSKILCEPQRDDRVDGVLVDDEVFVQSGHGERSCRGQRGLANLEPIQRLDLEHQWREPIGYLRREDVQSGRQRQVHMQSHLLVRTVRWRIRPQLDLELLTVRSWRVGR